MIVVYPGILKYKTVYHGIVHGNTPHSLILIIEALILTKEQTQDPFT